VEVYLVGGAVRDKLLGLPVAERDWVVVGATPADMLALGYRQVGRDFPVFLHPETHEEYALARTERKVAPGHRGFVCHTGPDVSLEDDLRRRDLTVNAIAEDSKGQLIDPWRGRQDLDRRCLRHVSEAFSEDPLRVFRVARIAAKLDALEFKVAPGTRALMKRIQRLGELERLSPERVWQELVKTLGTGSPWRFFQELEACDCLEPWFGELQSSLPDLIELWCSKVPDPEVQRRYPALGWVLDPTAMQNLSARLKAPAEYARMSVQVARYGSAAVQWKTLPPEAVLTCITQLGGLQKQQVERFETLLEVISDCAGYPLKGLSELAAQLRDIGKSAIPDELTGPALGHAIEELRLKTISEQLGFPG